MALFETNRPSITKLLVLILLSLALMAFDRLGSSWTQRINMGLGSTTDGIVRLLHLPGEWISALGENLADKHKLATQIEKMQQENLLLKGQIQRFFSLEDENQQLRQLLHGKEISPNGILLARFLGSNPNPEKHSFTINRGLQSGVLPGQAVIDGNGLIGQVLRSTMAGATVIELTSKHHAVSVLLDDTGFIGILKGTGDRTQLTMSRIPDRYPVKVGDLLTSSGLDGVFPRGYPVARITQVNDDKRHAFINVIAKPVANLSKLDLMLILTQSPGKPSPTKRRQPSGPSVDRPMVPAAVAEKPEASTVKPAPKGTEHAR